MLGCVRDFILGGALGAAFVGLLVVRAVKVGLIGGGS
jgi:hypothetical protein